MAPSHPQFIVGIGGSAGGLRAYIAFFDAVRDDTGMAFVVVSHTMPTNTNNILAEILSWHTKMPVQVASEAMTIRPDHVYVISPNSDLRIVDFAFNTTSPRTMNQQVDIFLTSLANAMGPRAVGIICSGYDGDGSKGCLQIKVKGGTTFAQDDSASVGGMPLSAQATGCIDFVLPLEQIASQLVKLVATPRTSRTWTPSPSR